MFRRIEEITVTLGLFTLSVMSLLLLGGTLIRVATVAAMAENGSEINFMPLAEQFLMAASALILTVAAWALNWGRSWLKAKTGVELEVSNKFQRDTLENWINRGAAYITQKIETSNWTKIGVRNSGVAAVAQMVIDHAPNTLKSFGYDPTTADGRARLQHWVESKLPEIDTVETSVNSPGKLPVAGAVS